MISFQVLMPIENKLKNEPTPIRQQIEYDRNIKNYYNNKNDPFPSLNAASKPPIYGQYNNANRLPVDSDVANKYSAFPSLDKPKQATTMNVVYQRQANIKPYDALYLDKFRKTKLW